MRLADRIAQCWTPFLVENSSDGCIAHLNNAVAFRTAIRSCATRYVLSDELTRLCTALAYSKGASKLACADLLHVPSESTWIEWAEAPWRKELALHGFMNPADASQGRRGVFIQSTARGRSGSMRTFWADSRPESDVAASSMEAHFDFDTQEGTDFEASDPQQPSLVCMLDEAVGEADILRRCFRFSFERSWQSYYDRARLTHVKTVALARHALGTIAIDMPVILAFLLLLNTRPSLPRRASNLERLNSIRTKSGKAPLLEHIEAFSPLKPVQSAGCGGGLGAFHRPRRRHQVRGHLVRRGSTLFWRVPHLRGSARAGTIRTRTVTWTFDSSAP